MNQYQNPFHDPRNGASKPITTHTLKPYMSHKGLTAYKLFDRAFDIVKDGTLIAQRAGVSKESLERIANGDDKHALIKVNGKFIRGFAA